MSFASAFTELSLPLLPLTDWLRAVLLLALLAGMLVFFRPLLSGIVRATLLLLRPRAARGARAVDGLGSGA